MNKYTRVKIHFLLWGTILVLSSCSRNPADNPTPQNPQPPSPPPLSGSIYGSAAGVFCLDLETGHPLWYTSTYGFSGTAPFVDSGSVYSCDVYGASSLDAATGKIKWSINYSSNFYHNNSNSYYCSPLVADSLLYTLGFTGSNGYACLYAIHKAKGIIVWQKILTGPATPLVSDFGQPKIVKEKIVVVGRDYDQKDRIFCFNRFTGNLLWTKICNTESITPSLFPQADETSIYISDASNNNLYALDINDGHTKWTVQLPMKQKVDHRLILSDQHLIGFGMTVSPTIVAVCFQVDKTNGAIVSNTSISGGILSISADSNNIYTNGGFLLSCVPLDSSSIKWQVTTQAKKAYDSLTAISIQIPWNFATDLISINGYVVTYNTYEAVPGVGTSTCYYNNIDIYDSKTGKIVKSNMVTNDCFYQYHGQMTIVQGKTTYNSPSGGL